MIQDTAKTLLEMTMSKFETFTYTPAELEEHMTEIAHNAFHYLHVEKYITKEQYEHLIDTMVIQAIPNRPGYGRKILDRLFGKEKSNDCWRFLLSKIDTRYNKAKKDTPNLTVVEGNFGEDEV